MNERKNTKQIKKDYYFPVIISQIFSITAVTVLFFFMLKGNGAGEVREKYSALLKEDFLTAEFSSVVWGMKEYLTENTSFAVFGARVEPYENPSLPNDETTTVPNLNAEEQTEFTVSQSVTYQSLSVAPKAETAPLKLVYNEGKEQILKPVADGRYTSYFGQRTDPIAEGTDYHKGIDIGADEGDPIMAAYSGRVSSVGEDARSGKYVFIEHEKGVETFYCHCSKILKKQGDKVKRGDTIALVGSTGYSTGPHLHFEVRINGESTDPLPLLKNAD